MTEGKIILSLAARVRMTEGKTILSLAARERMVLPSVIPTLAVRERMILPSIILHRVLRERMVFFILSLLGRASMGFHATLNEFFQIGKYGCSQQSYIECAY